MLHFLPCPVLILSETPGAPVGQDDSCVGGFDTVSGMKNATDAMVEPGYAGETLCHSRQDHMQAACQARWHDVCICKSCAERPGPHPPQAGEVMYMDLTFPVIECQIVEE